MNRIRNLVTNLLARRARTSLMLRRVRRGMESRLPLAAPVFTHLLDRPRERASSNGTNGHGVRRKMAKTPRRHPLAMVLGFTLPIGNGRGSSRLHIRTLFRLER